MPFRMLSVFEDAARKRKNELRELMPQFERAFARRWQPYLQRLQRVEDEIIEGRTQPTNSTEQLLKSRPKYLKG